MGFTDTLRVVGVVPLVGLAANHAVDVVTVKLSTLPLLLFTDTFCAGGALPPACAVNVKLVGLTVNPEPPASSSARTELVRKWGQLGRVNNGIASKTNAATSSFLRCLHMLPPSNF